MTHFETDMTRGEVVEHEIVFWDLDEKFGKLVNVNARQNISGFFCYCVNYKIVSDLMPLKSLSELK